MARAMAWRREYFALTALPWRAVVSICLMAARALSGRESMYDSMSERRDVMSARPQEANRNKAATAAKIMVFLIAFILWRR